MTCRCGTPTRDEAYVCDSCAGRLTKALAECPWLDGQLATTLVGEKGIDYSKGGGSRSTEHRLPVHLGAVDARLLLRRVLGEWVRFCVAEQVRHQSPDYGTPDFDVSAMSRWLMWRVDGLTLHDRGPDAVEEITAAYARGLAVIDRPADKWYAGPCTTDDCGVDLYARAQGGLVKCRACEASYDVAERRAWLLEAAEDRLENATNLARAVSWLGAEPLTPSKVRGWVYRKRLFEKGHDGKHPLYRIGDAIDLLAAETRKVV